MGALPGNPQFCKLWPPAKVLHLRKTREKNDMEMPRCVTLKVDPWVHEHLWFWTCTYIYICMYHFCLPWLSYTFHVAMAQPLQCSWWLRYNGESQWHGSPPSSASCFTFRLRMREPSPGQQDAQVGVNMKNPEGNLPDSPLQKKGVTSYIVVSSFL